MWGRAYPPPEFQYAKITIVSLVTRYDRTGGRLGTVKRTSQGGIEVPATLTRAGILVYRNPDGSERREYRPPDEVFRPESLSSLQHATVTNLHPPPDSAGDRKINPANFRDWTVGQLSGAPRQDGEKLEGLLVIQDGRTITQIEKGDRNEVSCGYTCNYDPTPGTTPGGERYDGVQRQIIYNHVALVPRGRAGRDVALRLDSAGNQERPEGQPGVSKMKIEIIGGTEYEVGTPAHTTAKAAQAQERADEENALETLTAERDTLKARVEELEATAAKEGERMDAAVAERVALVKVAETKGLKIEKDQSNDQIRTALLAKLSPSLRLDGKSDTYVQAALDMALASGNLTDAASRAIEDPAVERVDAADQGLAPDVLARENMIRRNSGRNEIDRQGNPLASK